MEQELDELGIGQSTERDFIRAADFVQVYANNIQMAMTLWDMNLVFGEIGEDPSGKPVIEQRVKVNMTKEMMKALYNLLKTNLAAYEAQLGPIQIQSPKAFEQVEGIEVAKRSSGKATTRKPKAKAKQVPST